MRKGTPLLYLGKRYLAVAVAALGCATPPCRAQQKSVPVQALLIKSIETDHDKVGDIILAKVRIDWQSSACSLRKGAILRGRIVDLTARTKSVRTSTLNLSFDSAECNGKTLKAFPLTVAALIAADTNQESDASHYQPLSEAIGVPAGQVAVNSGSLRSVTAAAATVYDEPHSYKAPKSVLPGQVIGIGGLKLSVGTGPEASSTLTASGHNVRLEPGTQLVLVPSVKTAALVTVARAIPTKATVGNSAPASPAIASVADELDDTAVCDPPHCSMALQTSDPTATPVHAFATLSIKNLGYSPAPDREIYQFDHDAALSYLGSQTLLFTFNPHLLVRREGENAPQMRTIRAVLIDVQSKKVDKTVDWRVLDAGQYLWPAGKDNVLVHVGHELRLYGPGLKLLQRLPLPGPLAFLRSSPSATYFAVGIIKERHSPAIHQQLVDAENQDPEEDAEVHVLNGNLRPIASALRSSRDAPPVLTDRGEIRVPNIGKNRWRIVELTWDRQSRVLGQVSSTCRPQVSSLLPDNLFLVGCDRQADGKWYRVLTSEGKPMLKGWSSSADLQHSVTSVKDAFAVGIAHSATSRNPDAPFHTDDIASEHIAVYAAENGQRAFAVTILRPIPTQQTFVLSPEHKQLAVLRPDEIVIYDIPTSTAKVIP